MFDSSSLRPWIPPHRSLMIFTNVSAWSFASPMSIANPRPSSCSSLTRMCEIFTASAVMPSSTAFGVSAAPAAGSQNESIPAKRLLRSMSVGTDGAGPPDVGVVPSDFFPEPLEHAATVISDATITRRRGHSAARPCCASEPPGRLTRLR